MPMEKPCSISHLSPLLPRRESTCQTVPKSLLHRAFESNFFTLASEKPKEQGLLPLLLLLLAQAKNL